MCFIFAPSSVKMPLTVSKLYIGHTFYIWNYKRGVILLKCRWSLGSYSLHIVRRSFYFLFLQRFMKISLVVLKLYSGYDFHIQTLQRAFSVKKKTGLLINLVPYTSSDDV